jgi:hypothetical protein
MSIFKDFRFSSNEARKLEFRLETYNTFNHTEFTLPNNGFGSPTATVFNGAFAAGSNGNFGRFNSTAAPRIMSLALKLMF